ncbi:PmoA family protein [Actinosynnema sp. NPDC053489]|uniref:PmoA family protein n=1 Tax=Actinosynnema sp. NPDC053489 TaxID=3363916 RepID=UPI0037CAD2F9
MSALALRHDVGTAVAVSDGVVELARYTYAPETPRLESPKPFLHPVRTRAGRVVSLFRPHDHVWHKGIAWSLPNVGDENFWGGPTYVRGRAYVQLDNNGAQRHRRVVDVGVEGGTARFAHELDWITRSGRTVVTEHRALTVTLLSDAAWALTFDTAMTNTSGREVAFGSPTTRGRENAGYGGLFWRGPRSFTGGVVVTPDGTGGDDVRGTRAEWMAFAGRHDGDDAESLVLVVDHRANPHHPPQWFTRSEQFACLNPAPFFSEELVVADGDTVRFRYGAAVADGGVADAAPLADAVRDVLRRGEG